MIPDIAVVEKRDCVRRLYDTKWKALDWHGVSWGIDRGDLYQVAAYAARYGCDWLGLIYPSDNVHLQKKVDVFELQCAGSPRVNIYALDLVSLVHGGSLPKGIGPPDETSD